MSDEKFTLFWRGPLSQWSPSKFTVDGEEYHNAEQYMMAEKSRLFGDKEMERKIMATSSPREAKDFGRRVKDFVNHKWQAVARDIVYKGNMAKFTQSKKIHKTALMETVGTTLVEASPTDKIWGIAITEDKPEAHDRKRWKGKNWLGEVLTKVRDESSRRKFETILKQEWSPRSSTGHNNEYILQSSLQVETGV